MNDAALCPTALEALERARAPGGARAVVEACLDRIDAREAEVGAWEIVDRDGALRAADSGPAGPLAGLPVGVKDVIDTGDLPTTYGSRMFPGHRPARDAACVATLRAAGAIVLGKTVSTEFASFHPGKTRNPRGLRHTPGGSSSGSAAAVADGMVPVALGTQTAGSVIRPASYCGVVGYKGTLGWTDTAGIHALAPSFDTLGVFARRVADLGPVRAALDPRARGRVLPLMPRIGLCRTAEWPSASAAARKTVEGAFAKLTAAGAPGFTVVSPPAWDRLVETHKTVMFPEMVPIFDGYIARGPDLISEGFKAQVADGRAIPPARLAAARVEMAARRADVARMIGAGEVWLAPAAPDEAPEGIERTGDPVFNRVWTLLGVPCLTLPAGKGKRGLPIGIQLIAAPGEDDALLDAAAWIEAALGAAG